MKKGTPMRTVVACGRCPLTLRMILDGSLLSIPKSLREANCKIILSVFFHVNIHPSMTFSGEFLLR